MNDDIEKLTLEPEEEPKQSKWEKIKELWNNPKTHSIIVLALWLIFFAFAVLFVKIISISSETKTEIVLTPVQKYNEMTSYEFSYKAEDLSLNGMAYNDKYLLYLDNQKYYKNNSLYKVGDNVEISTEPEILKLDNKMIYSLIKDIKPVNNSYLVPLVTFINTYEQTQINSLELSSYNITVSTYEKDDTINKVVLDLTNYYKYKGINTDSYILTINYYNINNISDFTKEYDEMIGVGL